MDKYNVELYQHIVHQWEAINNMFEGNKTVTAEDDTTMAAENNADMMDVIDEEENDQTYC